MGIALKGLSYSKAANIAIIVLGGEIETLGKRVGPYSVVFYKGGNRHGLSNPGKEIAQYIMFEFHGSQVGVRPILYRRVRSLLNKLRDPKRWSRKLKHLGNQVKHKWFKKYPVKVMRRTGIGSLPPCTPLNIYSFFPTNRSNSVRATDNSNRAWALP